MRVCCRLASLVGMVLVLAVEEEDVWEVLDIGGPAGVGEGVWELISVVDERMFSV